MTEKCAVYHFNSKTYEPVGGITWGELKAGDVYLNSNGRVGQIISSGYNKGSAKIWKRVKNYQGTVWLRRQKDFKITLLVEVNTTKPNNGETKMTDQQLFKIKGTEHFGNVIATDSQGNKVFEIRGGGGIQVVKAEQIEEVFPFTFSVVFVGNNNNNGTHYHFLGKEGDFTVGELLIYENGVNNIGICKVCALDTKSRSATKPFSGYRLDAQKV